MKAGWTYKNLADLCTFFGDGDWIESKDQSSNGIRLIQTGNVGEGVFKDRGDKARYINEETFDKLRCTEIFEGDCLISRLPDPVGRSAILPETGERMITAVDCTILRFNHQLCLPEFFNYYSQSIEYINNISERCTGTTRNRISRSQLGNTPIPTPEVGEQRRIVTLLDEAFADIATAKANAEKNLQNARELCEGLMQALFPDDENVVPDSPSLDSLCELIVDCEHKTAPTQETGIPSIRTPNIGKGRLILEGVYRVSDETYAEWTRRGEPQGGDLILAREAPAGNVAVIPEGTKVCLGQRTVLIRPKKSVFEPAYLAQLLLRQNSQRRLLAHSRGATVQHINMKDIRAFKIGAIPSLADQQRIVNQVNELFDTEDRLVSIYRQKLTALDDLKKSLLHQAFSGQL